MSIRDDVEAILMGDGDITEMTNALMTELNRARADAWGEGWNAGTLSQFTEPSNPYRPTP